MDFRPIRFIGQQIEVAFAEPPLFEKTPPCPNRFFWNDDTFDVITLLSQWDDFNRSGRTVPAMRSHHAALAQQRGSWGVGRFFFRVETECGRFFDLYYDRAPKDADDRKGTWYLFREMKPVQSDNNEQESRN